MGPFLFLAIRPCYYSSMTQVLLLSEDQKFNHFLRNTLVEKYAFEVLVRNGVAEAISILDLLPTIELVVCKDSLAKKIIDYF